MISSPNVKREDLSRVLETCQPHMKPIVLAMRDFGCSYAIILQDAGPFTIPLVQLKPAIVHIGDDLQTSKGPGAFDPVSMLRITRLCSAAWVIASAPVEDLYAQLAMTAAVQRRHVLLVETRPEHEEDWTEFLLEAHPALSISVSRADPNLPPEPQTWGRA